MDVFILMLRLAPSGSARIKRIGIGVQNEKTPRAGGDQRGGAGLPPGGAGRWPAVDADTEQSALGMYSERSTKISLFRWPQEKIVEKGAIAQLAGRRL